MRQTDRERYWMEGRADAIVDMVASKFTRPMVRAADIAKILDVPYPELVKAVDRRVKRARRRSMAMAVKRRTKDPAVEPGMKRCSRCQTIKPYTDFSANARKADGCQGYCKPCWNAYNRERHLKAVV